jgi:UDP-4-amino-4,6-dideoxy-N-acetyl-beta-L-altrosamine N-acetyltransferase
MEGTAQNDMFREVSKYGIILKRLTEEDLELLRNWRNDPKIVKQMNYKEYITPEMQQKWYSGINNRHNYYFIIVVDGKKIGLANLKDIDYNHKIMEAGLFIYDDDYLGTLVPFQVVLAKYDFGFLDLGMETCFGHVLRSNTNAIRFNASLGYELKPGQENEEHQLYILTKERYLGKRELLLKKLSRIVDW